MRASQRTASKSSPTAAANKLGFSPTDKTKQAAAQAPKDQDAIPADAPTDGTLPQLTDDLQRQIALLAKHTATLSDQAAAAKAHIEDIKNVKSELANLKETYEEQFSELQADRAALTEAQITLTTAISEAQASIPDLVNATAQAATAATETLVATQVQDACASAYDVAMPDVEELATSLAAAIANRNKQTAQGPTVAEKITTATLLKQLHVKMDALAAHRAGTATQRVASPRPAPVPTARRPRRPTRPSSPSPLPRPPP